MRLVRRQIATQEEICRAWSIGDVLDWNDLLDLEEEAELRVAEQRDAEMRARSKRG
jgi:hypothetical protein